MLSNLTRQYKAKVHIGAFTGDLETELSIIEGDVEVK